MNRLFSLWCDFKLNLLSTAQLSFLGSMWQPSVNQLSKQKRLIFSLASFIRILAQYCNIYQFPKSSQFISICQRKKEGKKYNQACMAPSSGCQLLLAYFLKIASNTKADSKTFTVLLSLSFFFLFLSHPFWHPPPNPTSTFSLCLPFCLISLSPHTLLYQWAH